LKKNQLLCFLDSLEATNGALVTEYLLEEHVMVILEGKFITSGGVMVYLCFNSSPIKKQIYVMLRLTSIIIFNYLDCRLFDRGLAYVGTDYRSDLLWDEYIRYEESQQAWSNLAMIYTRILEHPIQQFDRYYNWYHKISFFYLCY
jgi:hypothetical protein